MRIGRNGHSLTSLAFGLLGAMLSISSANAYTTCGNITVSETWDLAGSPYTLTCDVVVMPGATLTIDPGVKVFFDPGVRLRTQGGVISAVGAFANVITFESVDPSNVGVGLEIGATPAQTSGVFKYCDFRYLQTAIYIHCCAPSQPNPPVTVDDCTFDQCSYGMNGYTGTTATVNNSIFVQCFVGAGQADLALAGCFFSSCTAGVQCMERSTITGCTFLACTTGLDLCGSGLGSSLTNSTVQFCGTGVKYPTTMERCDISSNTVGVVLGVYHGLIRCNDIYSNSTHNLQTVSHITSSIPNNWWGTTNTAAIDASIRDGYDQAGLGFILYTPILTANQSATGCNCVNASISTQPVSATKYGSQPVSFSVSGSGTPPLTYQWYRNNVPITNGGRWAGATSPTLSILPIAYNGGDFGWTDAGTYHCTVSNLCNTATSNVAFLTVNDCFADFNHNGSVSPQDLFSFLAAYFAGCP